MTKSPVCERVGSMEKPKQDRISAMYELNRWTKARIWMVRVAVGRMGGRRVRHDGPGMMFRCEALTAGHALPSE